VEWLLLITSENVHDRLRWGFQICDVDCSGRVSAAEVTALIRLMFGVLTGLELDPNNPYVGDLVCSLFQTPDNSTSGRVSGQKEGATGGGGGPGGRGQGGRGGGGEGREGGFLVVGAISSRVSRECGCDDGAIAADAFISERILWGARISQKSSICWLYLVCTPER